MLLVETFVTISPGKGLGLFAKSKIKKGTIYWQRNELFDRVYTQKELYSFNQLSSIYVEIHGFQEKNGNWYICGDNARFSNHSDLPNSKNHFNEEGLLEYCTIAEDLLEGEEILCDYTELCLTCKNGVNFITKR